MHVFLLTAQSKMFMMQTQIANLTSIIDDMKIRMNMIEDELRKVNQRGSIDTIDRSASDSQFVIIPKEEPNYISEDSGDSDSDYNEEY